MNLCKLLFIVLVMHIAGIEVYPSAKSGSENMISNKFKEQVGKKVSGKSLPYVKISDSKSAFEFYPKDKSQNFKLDTGAGCARFINDDIEYKYEFIPDSGNNAGLCKETIIVNKPLKNNEIVFEIETGNLEFHYQRPLTPEEKAMGIFRSQNIEGSYAVYYKSTVQDEVSRKAFHIFRPDITDKLGKHAWCDLIVDTRNRIMKIIIPLPFLDSALYPLTIDPTIGYTTVGSTEISYPADRLVACGKFTMPDGGTAVSAKLFTGNTGSTISIGLYTDNDGYPAQLIDTSQPYIIENEGWVSLPLNLNCHLSYGKSYWIALNHSGSALKLYFDDIGPQKIVFVSYPFGSGDMPYVFPESGEMQTGMKFSAYAEYDQTEEDPVYVPRRNAFFCLNGIKTSSVTIKNAETIDKSLAGWFDFNGDSRDRTGQNNVTEHGLSAPQYFAGQNGDYYVFLAGNNSRECIETGLNSQDLGHSYTISMRLCPADMRAGSGLPQILGTSDKRLYPLYFDGISGEGYLKVNIDLYNVFRQQGFASYSKTLDLSDIISVGNWFHFAQTYDLETNLFTVFINGTKKFQLDCRPFEQLISFQTDDLSGIQGVACDNEHIYTTGSDYISKYDFSGMKIGSINTPEGIVGGICVYGDYIYIPWMDAYPMPSECGIFRLNKNGLVLDTSFAENGYLDLTQAIPNKCVAALCFADGYFYLTSFSNKIYKFSPDFAGVCQIFALDTKIASITGVYENTGGQSFELLGTGIDFDQTGRRFHISYRANLVLTVNSDFDNDSIQYYMPRDENSLSIFCHGIGFMPAEPEKSGIQTVIFADRVAGTGNTVRIMRRKNASCRYYPVSWNNLIFGTSFCEEFDFYNGAIQDARIYRRTLSEDEIRLLYESQN